MPAPASILAIQYVRLIGAQLRTMGLSVDEWLGRSGLTPSDLHQPDVAIDLGRFRGLIHDGIAMTGEPALPLYVGEQLGVQAHGVLSYAILASPTVGEMLSVIERYLSLRIRLLSLRVEVHHDEVRARFQEHIPLGSMQAPLLEGLVTTVKTVVEDVTMGACRIQRVVFAFPRPGHAAVAQSILGVPLTYGGSWTGFTLSAASLDRPLRLSDPEAFRMAEAHCRRQLEAMEAGRSWSERVRRELLRRPGSFPDQDAVAQRLHMSRRTLHRHLKGEGTSFRKLTESIRTRMATEQLREGEASIDEIAYLLGYADPANFRRAFRRWTGEAPSHYRARIRAEGRDGSEAP